MILFRVWLTMMWFRIHGEILNFHAWTLFIIMNSFTITERNKNQWIYQWICHIQIIWKLSYVNLLGSLFFELFEHWTMLIVFLLLVMILSIWLITKPNKLRNFISEISEKLDQTSLLQKKGSCKISRVRLYICPYVRPSVTHFLRIYSVDFLNFFALVYFAIYTNKWQSQILENCICCLDNRVNETNFLGSKTIFGILSGTTFVL